MCAWLYPDKQHQKETWLYCDHFHSSSSEALCLTCNVFLFCSNVQGDSQTSICITIEPGLLLKGDILVRNVEGHTTGERSVVSCYKVNVRVWGQWQSNFYQKKKGKEMNGNWCNRRVLMKTTAEMYGGCSHLFIIFISDIPVHFSNPAS